ncbi:MAG: hypothetical protein K9L73_06845 [Spirochaetia bacterium]|nr:hypothetical protein [Spirochaetia bacterium]
MIRLAGLLLMLLAVAAAPIAAEDLDDLFGSSDTAEDDLFGSSSDTDDLFGGDSLVEDVVETDLALSDLLLTNDQGPVISGSYSFSISPRATWSVDDQELSWGLSGGISSRLILDARPSADTRFFLKADMAYPYTDRLLSLKELFGDFDIDDRVFFRVGKQTLNWGVGYFFSPANLLNITDIDPADAEAELEGPLSVKMNMPIGIDNLYGYVIIPEASVDLMDLAYAIKYEKVIGSSEVGIGGYYTEDQAPSLMATLSTTTFGDIMLFGEVLLRYGSDATFITGITPPSTVNLAELPDDRFYGSATAGFMFSKSFDGSDLGISLTGQYYYNGESYDGADLIAVSFINSGAHYGAANLSVSLTDELSAGVFWYGNMSDLSGMVRPVVSWTVDDTIRISLDASITYGDAGDQFTPDIPLGEMTLGHVIIPTLSISLGGAQF